MSDGWGLLESPNAGAVIRKTSVIDVPFAIEWFRSTAEQALLVPWYEPLPWIDQPYVAWNVVSREPVGVCAGIIPWNYPLSFAMWKLAPAIAMGNSIILKPSPQTPLTALELVKAIDETGLLPKGVINVITGDSADRGAELVEHPDVDTVTFTGSTATGRRVMAAAASTIKRVTREIGKHRVPGCGHGHCRGRHALRRPSPSGTDVQSARGSSCTTTSTTASRHCVSAARR